MAFRDVIGHRRLVALLSRSVQRESLPPSLIFAGPEGIGKRLAAIAVAQALNCVAPGRTAGADACGECTACRRIARGVHPDVLIVGPEDSGSIKIDQVRDIVDRSGYRPFEGRRRAVIIDEADTLVPAAQNALLKTLEEPPAGSIFILVTSRPDMLLPTVQSRCPRLRFAPLDAAEVTAALVRLGRAEAEARALAAGANGSVGAALTASAGDLVEARDIAARAMADATISNEPRRRLEAAKALVGGAASGDREALVMELRAMASLVRDVELIAARGESGALANADARSQVEKLSAFKGERGLRAFQAIDRALVALDRNAGVKTVADWVMLHL